MFAPAGPTTPSDWLLREALRLAELGYRVLPCLRLAKRPYTPNGFHDASTDPSQIEQWWSRWPQANLAVSCEGLLVIDIDPLLDDRQRPQQNPWPTDPARHEELYMLAGAIAQTPRKGRHLWFRLPEGKRYQPKAGVLAPGVDLRTTGSYVIVPPSRTVDGPYLWVPDAELSFPPAQLPLPPDWLIEQLDRLAVKPNTDSNLSSNLSSPSTDQDIIPAGQRNSRLASLAGGLRYRGLSSEEIEAALLVMNRRRCRPPLPEEEVRTIAQSISRYPAGVVDGLDGVPEPRPFPVEVLPEPVRSFVVGCASALGCHPAYIALPVLVVAGSAIGNARRLELKQGWNALPILWGAVVGESGTLKTAALQIVLRPVRARQKLKLDTYQRRWQEYEEQVACYDKSISRWRSARSDTTTPPPARPQPPICEQCIVSDTTIEALGSILQDNPFGVLLARDELAAWVNSFDRYSGRGKLGADAANWLSTFNSENLVVDRKSGSPRTLFIPAAAVSVLGGVQPRILARCLGSEHRESGLAARLLLAYPPRQVKSWTESGCPVELVAAWGRLVDRLFTLREGCWQEGQVVPRLVQMDESARSQWVQFFNANAQELAELTSDLAAAWSKFEEYAARLALVLHYLKWAAGDSAEEGRLDADSMAGGIRLVEWFKNEARRVYYELDTSGTDRRQEELVELVRRQGGTMTLREARNHCRWLRSPGAAEAAFQSLVDAGLAYWQIVAPTATGGRPTRRLVLVAADDEPADD